jgi:3-oxoacyl-[acyl-carrier protein] reductase
VSEGRLNGKVAVVTGAARGIGAATAGRLAREGACVMLADLDEAPLQQATAELRREGAVVDCEAGNLSAPDVASRLIDRTVRAFGGLDIIVNNAGYIWPQAIHRMSDDQFEALVDIHVGAPFRILRAAATPFRELAKRESASGRLTHRKVVNVSSIIGLSGAPMSANYAAGKAAVVGLTKTLAKEWGRYRVNVNCVAFGMIATRLNDPDVAKSPLLEVGGRTVNVGTMGANYEDMQALIPLGRAGTVEEAAAGILMLCLPEADYVTGQVLVVGGGLE